MNRTVEAFIDSKKDDIIRSVQQSVRYPSVEGEPAGEGAPRLLKEWLNENEE